MRTHQGVHGSADKQRSRSKLIEEFLFDNDPYLSLDAQTPSMHMHKQAAKLRTVSIIDTLSELTPGEIDKEDLYRPFNSFVPGLQTHQSSIHSQNNSSFQAVNRRHNEQEIFLNDIQAPTVNRNIIRAYDTFSTLRPSNRQTVQQYRGGIPQSIHSPGYTKEPFAKHRYSSGTECPYLSDTGLTHRVSVVKQPQHAIIPMTSTTHSNPVSYNAGQKSKWQSPFSHTAEDNLRHCFSDSEIEASELFKVNVQSATQGTMDKLKYKSDDCLDSDPRHGLPTNRDWTVESWVCSLGEPTGQDSSKGGVFPRRYRRKSRMPEWIRFIFKVAKQGNLEMLKAGMKDMDSALVRNLSDCNGNNLWHVCSARNYLPCVQWLSNKFGHEPLKDENKSAQTPCILAVKHGSLSVVQWLLEHTSCQVLSTAEGSRSLLHYASKYGQACVLSWLVDYMTKLNMDVNAKDAEGNTALHLAAKYGHIQCVKDLVLSGCDMSSCNELGLKPYDLAVFSQQSSCAEYLISLETCLALAKDQYALEGDTQRYRTENSDVKRNFKDLLQSMKSSLRHQREMLDACKRIQAQWFRQHDIDQDEIEEDHIQKLSHQLMLQRDEFERWFSSLIMKDESVCQMIEDRWKRQSRKASRHTYSKREPLDILRSQFVQTQVKANSLMPLPDVSILSSSESEFSDESVDENATQKISSNLGSHSNALHRQNALLLENCSKLTHPSKLNSQHTRKRNKTGSSYESKVRPWTLHVSDSDMDLRDLFERNPELKQEGQTCSVLEVLEPSSSENEELAQLERHYTISVKESKSSNSLESESSSSSGSKSKVRSTQDILLTAKCKESQVDLSCCMPPSGKMPATVDQHKLLLKQQTSLISKQHGKDKTKMVDTVRTSESKSCTDSASRSTKSNPSTSGSSDSKSLDSESRIEADSITLHSNTADCIESSSPESSPELAVPNQSSVLKKKGFLLKFSLKNRWSSKQKQRGNKKSSDNTSDELKEAKGDSTCSIETGISNQTDSLTENHEPSINEDILVVEIHNASVQQPKKVERFLPPPPPPPPTTRRDPPPMPPSPESKQYTNPPTQLECSGNLLPDILNSATLEETPTEHSSQTEQSGQSSNDQFCSSSDVSRLYCTSAKSDSRPPSSASRIDSTLRPEDAFKSIGFPLRKTSSASTELLLTPDLSTTGRHSPAPSEVSKTESALSPPSDVSKTESQRHASHLGKIEETTANTKKAVEVKVASILDIGIEGEGAEGQCMELRTFIHQEPDAAQEYIQKKTSVKEETSNKPWYEVSDDEDILSPGRSLGNQSNSEDESHSLLR